MRGEDAVQQDVEQSVWLIDGILIIFGQQFSSVAQKNKVHQALESKTKQCWKYSLPLHDFSL